MSTVNSRLFGPAALTTSAATKYTAPSGSTVTITRMRVSNPDSVVRTFTFSIGTDAVGTRLYAAVEIPAGGGKDIYGPFTLEEDEFVQSFGGTGGTVLVLTINGKITTP